MLSCSLVCASFMPRVALRSAGPTGCSGPVSQSVQALDLARSVVSTCRMGFGACSSLSLSRTLARSLRVAAALPRLALLCQLSSVLAVLHRLSDCSFFPSSSSSSSSAEAGPISPSSSHISSLPRPPSLAYKQQPQKRGCGSRVFPHQSLDSHARRAPHQLLLV